MAEAPFVEKVQYDREKRRADQAEAELADAKYGIEGHVEDKRKLRERAERAEADRDFYMDDRAKVAKQRERAEAERDQALRDEQRVWIKLRDAEAALREIAEITKDWQPTSGQRSVRAIARAALPDEGGGDG